MVRRITTYDGTSPDSAHRSHPIRERADHACSPQSRPREMDVIAAPANSAVTLLVGCLNFLDSEAQRVIYSAHQNAGVMKNVMHEGTVGRSRQFALHFGDKRGLRSGECRRHSRRRIVLLVAKPTPASRALSGIDRPWSGAVLPCTKSGKSTIGPSLLKPARRG